MPTSGLVFRRVSLRTSLPAAPSCSACLGGALFPPAQHGVTGLSGSPSTLCRNEGRVRTAAARWSSGLKVCAEQVGPLCGNCKTLGFCEELWFVLHSWSHPWTVYALQRQCFRDQNVKTKWDADRTRLILMLNSDPVHHMTLTEKTTVRVKQSPTRLRNYNHLSVSSVIIYQIPFKTLALFYAKWSVLQHPVTVSVILKGYANVCCTILCLTSLLKPWHQNTGKAFWAKCQIQGSDL